MRLLAWTNLDVVCQQTVEKVDVGVAKDGEVLVLLNGSLLHVEQSKTWNHRQLQLCKKGIPKLQLTSLDLCLVAVNTRRGETVCPQVLPGLGLVGGVIVGTTIMYVRLVANIVVGMIDISIDRSIDGWMLTVRGGHVWKEGCGGRA